MSPSSAFAASSVALQVVTIVLELVCGGACSSAIPALSAGFRHGGPRLISQG